MLIIFNVLIIRFKINIFLVLIIYYINYRKKVIKIFNFYYKNNNLYNYNIIKLLFN